eukprot:CAMPEP_0170513228 /NCGR_PEP_ID=MMETSP0208-20121228/67288_1 /TAXON_ID=197538 /ORGANISM="Strombidium inclinatum, Strain S3" /LENGTH=42 /DNA_ID= /DNA_START= /DNA_END= /DNA_ORIENTATION=
MTSGAIDIKSVVNKKMKINAEVKILKQKQQLDKSPLHLNEYI